MKYGLLHRQERLLYGFRIILQQVDCFVDYTGHDMCHSICRQNTKNLCVHFAQVLYRCRHKNAICMIYISLSSSSLIYFVILYQNNRSRRNLRFLNTPEKTFEVTVLPDVSELRSASSIIIKPFPFWGQLWRAKNEVIKFSDLFDLLPRKVVVYGLNRKWESKNVSASNYIHWTVL